jgi:primary-amine oxidase
VPQTTTTHPLDPLTPDEIARAVASVHGTGKLTEAARFSTITIDDRRDREGRHARLVIVPGPEADLVEATVALASGEVVSWVLHEDVRPALGFEESLNAIVALHEHDGFRKALAERGITDLEKVQIDPWPTGRFGIATPTHRPLHLLLPRATGRQRLRAPDRGAARAGRHGAR